MESSFRLNTNREKPIGAVGCQLVGGLRLVYVVVPSGEGASFSLRPDYEI